MFDHDIAGQPRRHLLTTGWSIFVSQKNLVSGDAVLFLRYILSRSFAFEQYICKMLGNELCKF